MDKKDTSNSDKLLHTAALTVEDVQNRNIIEISLTHL